MNIDALADLLKNRGCQSVAYFHTDHFEPWSTNIDTNSLRAVERMAAMARTSPYAKRLSLFYNVFIPYRLESDSPGAADSQRVPGDQVAFFARTARQEDLARTAVRPLVAMDQHEMHLHVHHEYWTRNMSHFDHPVSRWVNASSTAGMDHERLDLHLTLCREAIAREIGAPFNRYAFIHGNWALNASDPLICQVTDEIGLLMQHGAFADFSFPAGRSYCDPKIEAPFTCLPLDCPRAYDDERSEPRCVGDRTEVMGADRFFIWNSPIKSIHSSLDYYSAANRAVFRNPERLVWTWLSKSVCLGGRLFIKTHAHSMKSDYRLADPGTVIPHCYPDVIAIFDCLARVCERAKIELLFATVNEVVDFIGTIDGAYRRGQYEAAERSPRPGSNEVATERGSATAEVAVARSPGTSIVAPSAVVATAPVISNPQVRPSFSTALSSISSILSGSRKMFRSAGPEAPTRGQEPPVAGPNDAVADPIPVIKAGEAMRQAPDSSPGAVTSDLMAMHQDWLERHAVNSGSPQDDLYESKLARGQPLEEYEIAISEMIACRFEPATTRILEIGSGWGGLAILLARMGYEVHCFEGNVGRHMACQWHFDRQIDRFPILHDRLHLEPVGLFPAIFSEALLAPDKTNLCIATNITHSYTADHQREVVHAAARCTELIVDLARFGLTRNLPAERELLLEMMRWADLEPVEQLFFSDPYDYWRLHSRASRSIGWDSSFAPAIQSAPGAFPAIAQAVSTGVRIPPAPARLASEHGALFSVFGDRHLEQCPVCHSAAISALWRMPATTLPKPIELFGGYFNQIPTLQVPGTLYCFDFCQDCESIFLNPVSGAQKQSYRSTDHYIRKMRSQSEWRGYEDVYDSIARWIPANATVMLDAACGIGQYLQLARRRATRSWDRLIGFELSSQYVEQMRREGFEAHVFDLDADDPLPIVPADSVDFITFSEAFEHVEQPLDALRKLLTVLRPGGRLYFTAQRYGTDVQAAVRPGEPIYIGEKVVNELPQRLGCRIVSKTTSGIRYYLVLEK